MVGTVDPDRGLHVIDESETLAAPMRHYVGSVAASGDGESVAADGSAREAPVNWDNHLAAL